MLRNAWTPAAMSAPQIARARAGLTWSPSGASTCGRYVAVRPTMTSVGRGSALRRASTARCHATHSLYSRPIAGR